MIGSGAVLALLTAFAIGLLAGFAICGMLVLLLDRLGLLIGPWKGEQE